jgi:hypothetical protein
MNSNALKITTYFGLFLLISGASYFLFGKVLSVSTGSPSPAAPVPTTTAAKTGTIQFAGPKIAPCPINGELHTAEEQKIWETRRPLEVMIENQVDARPQSGLQNADIVYEAVAEGGITRFMGVFYCNVLAGSPNKYDVGPVRSARTYFLDLASEYSDYPLYAHVGGANCSGGDSAGNSETNCSTDRRAQALEQISQYGWTNKGTWGDLNQFSLSYQACRREPERTGTEKATEHTMYCNTTELWNVAASRGLTNMTVAKNVSWDKNFRPWTFKQAEAPSSTPTTSIAFDFWPGATNKDYSVVWNYDSATNRYLRSNGGQKQIDFNTGEQLSTKNVVIEFAKETTGIDSHGHLLYGMIGTGTGMLYQNGNKVAITWSKSNRVSRTIFKTTDGKEVNFVPGQVWVEILPIGNTISYEGQS